MGNLNNTKSPRGRMSKIHPWLVALREVFSEYADTADIWIYTDEDILFLVNQKLPKKDRIGESTFRTWKVTAREGKREDLPDHFVEFLALYKNALLLAKKCIMSALATDPQKWQRWAWIMERKFPNWRMNNITPDQLEDKLNNEIEFNVSVIEKNEKTDRLNFDKKAGDSVGGTKE